MLNDKDFFYKAMAKLANMNKYDFDDFDIELTDSKIGHYGYDKLKPVIIKFYEQRKCPSIQDIRFEIEGIPVTDKQIAESLIPKIWALASKASTLKSEDQINAEFKDSEYLQNFFTLKEIKELGESKPDSRPVLTAQLRERLIIQINLKKQGLTVADAELSRNASPEDIEKKRQEYTELPATKNLMLENKIIEKPTHSDNINEQADIYVELVFKNAENKQNYTELPNTIKRFINEKQYQYIIETSPENHTQPKIRLFERIVNCLKAYQLGIDLEKIELMTTENIKQVIKDRQDAAKIAMDHAKLIIDSALIRQPEEKPLAPGRHRSIMGQKFLDELKEKKLERENAEKAKKYENAEN